MTIYSVEYRGWEEQFNCGYYTTLEKAQQRLERILDTPSNDENDYLIEEIHVE